jgi:hypothetical protein
MCSESDNAALIKDIISKGELVPVVITIALIKAAMLENGWEVGRSEPEIEVPDRWLS